MSENQEHEARAARLLWEQVERLRGGAPCPEAEDAADEESAALARVAAELAAWMASDDSGARRASAHEKMWARIAEIAPATERAPAPCATAARVPWWRRPVRPWHWAAAAAALAALFLGPRALRPPVSEHLSAPHETVIREVRQLVANTMPPEETRAAWQHMLECPGCFERYKAAWEQQHGRANGAGLPPRAPWRVAVRGR